MLPSLPRPTFVLFVIASVFVVVTLSWMMRSAHIRSRRPSASSRQRTLLQSRDPKTSFKKPHSCTPQRKVVFLKTHKTGSTTVASIFQRYGYINNLTFLVPDNRHFVNYRKPFSADLIGNDSRVEIENESMSLEDIRFDVLTNHARYQRREMDRAFPGAKYVTILREPASQFESAFYYFEIWRSLPRIPSRKPLVLFMEDPKKYFDLVMSKRQYYKDSMHNQQLFDLGMEHSQTDDEGAVERKIRELDSEFDLVMITEYFDESLVLLRRLLCWRMDDIVYLAKGTRSPNYRDDANKTLHAQIRAWNRADVQLYRHFNATFWRRVERYGPEFARDLALFRRKLSLATKECCNASRVNSRDRRVELFSLNNDASERCHLLAKGDVEFTNLIRKRMQNQDVPMYRYRETRYKQKKKRD